MIRIKVKLLAILLMSTSFYVEGSKYYQPKKTQATDQVIVKLKPNVSSKSKLDLNKSLTSLAKNKGAEIRFLKSGAFNTQVYKLSKFRKQTELKSLITELKKHPHVEYAEPDYINYPDFVPNDSLYSMQEHYFDNTWGINLPDAWDIARGNGVVVAVLDTGTVAHDDLSANYLPGYDMISSAARARDGNGRDNDPTDQGDWASNGECGSGNDQNSSWHGTHVSGTIAARTDNGIGVAGVAFESQIVPVRVLGRCGGYTSDIADGIIWASGGNVSGAPTNQNPADIINMSLGGEGSCGSTYQNAINYARSRGVSVVVSAGNDNANVSGYRPANCSNVIAVAATNRSGGKASFSNYGSKVDLAAPGVNVNSTSNAGITTEGNEMYRTNSGTSMAAPHVSGVAALMLSVKPGLSTSAVEGILKASARAFPDACNDCGTGIVDALSALQMALREIGSHFYEYGACRYYTRQGFLTWESTGSGSTYTLQRKTGNNWYNIYTGTSPIRRYDTTESDRTHYLRVKSTKDGVSGRWRTMNIFVPKCWNGGGPLPH